MSTRQFEPRFTREIGMAPKLFARIARFEAALESKALSIDNSWTDVANRLGYFDQIHLIHDSPRLSLCAGDAHNSLPYSAFACLRIGASRSPSFHRPRKS
jgi:AraC-like DNA-binding protein